MKKMPWTAAVLGLAASLAIAQDVVDNPAYKQWSAFKVGTMVKQKTTSTFSMGENAKETVTAQTMTQTLKELTPEKAVLEVVVEMEVNGKPMTLPARTQEIPAKVAKGPTTEPAPAPDVKVTKTEGDEEIEVAGKKYKCHWVEMKTVSDKSESTMRSWISAEVPGGLVKTTMERTSPKMKSTMEVVEFKAGA